MENKNVSSFLNIANQSILRRVNVPSANKATSSWMIAKFVNYTNSVDLLNTGTSMVIVMLEMIHFAYNIGQMVDVNNANKTINLTESI
jgi:hypothetical protein